MNNNTKEVTHHQFLAGVEGEAKRIANWLDKTQNPAHSCTIFILDLLVHLGYDDITNYGILEEVKMDLYHLINSQDEDEEDD